MLNDMLKWFFRTSAFAVLWVFIFSITINGKPFFNYANEVLVQNDIVRFLDRELNELWVKFKDTAAVTFSDPAARDEKV